MKNHKMLLLLALSIIAFLGYSYANESKTIEDYVLDSLEITPVIENNTLLVYIKNTNTLGVFDGDIIIEVVENINNNKIERLTSNTHINPILDIKTYHLTLGPYGIKKITYKFDPTIAEIYSNNITYNIYAINTNKAIIGWINSHLTPITINQIINIEPQNKCYIDRTKSNIGGAYGAAGPLMLEDEIEGYVAISCNDIQNKDYVLEVYVCDYWNYYLFSNEQITRCNKIMDKSIKSSEKGIMITLNKSQLPYDANSIVMILKHNNLINDIFTSRIIIPHNTSHLVEFVWYVENETLKVIATYTGPYYPQEGNGSSTYKICLKTQDNKEIKCYKETVQEYTDHMTIKEYSFNLPKNNTSTKICINEYCKLITSNLHDIKAEKELKKITSPIQESSQNKFKNYTLALVALLLIFGIMLLFFILKHKKDNKISGKHESIN